MVTPLAPHIAEELWARLGHPRSLAYEPFPAPDPALAREPSVRLPVQVNGKVRFTVGCPPGPGRRRSAGPSRGTRLSPRHRRPPVRRIVVVPGRIANVVTAPAAC